MENKKQAKESDTTHNKLKFLSCGDLERRRDVFTKQEGLRVEPYRSGQDLSYRKEVEGIPGRSAKARRVELINHTQGHSDKPRLAGVVAGNNKA